MAGKGAEYNWIDYEYLLPLLLDVDGGVCSARLKAQNKHIRIRVHLALLSHTHKRSHRPLDMFLMMKYLEKFKFSIWCARCGRTISFGINIGSFANLRLICWLGARRTRVGFGFRWQRNREWRWIWEGWPKEGVELSVRKIKSLFGVCNKNQGVMIQLRKKPNFNKHSYLWGRWEEAHGALLHWRALMPSRLIEHSLRALQVLCVCSVGEPLFMVLFQQT